MSFGSIIFTNKGKLLQSKAQSGVNLNFTRMAIGDGELSGQAIQELNGLINEKKSISITTLKVQDSGKVQVGGIISNQDIITGFYWREVGLFADDPDVGEVLYCYGNAGDLAEYIPASGGAEILEKELNIIAIVDNASIISATIDNSLVYVTQSALLSELGDKANLQTTQKDNLVNAINEVLQDAVDTDNKIGELSTLSTTDKSSVVNAVNEAFQSGVNRKQEVVDALNSKITIPSSTTDESWDVLIPKINDIKEGSGDAQPEHVLAPHTFTNDEGVQKIGAMVDRGSVGTQNLTSEGAEYTIPQGYHNGLGKVKAVITGLIASVIKAGTTVGNIVGTFTADANILANQMLSGKIGYVNGVKLTGTMPDRSGDTASLSSVVSGNTLKLKASNGYRDGVNDYVTITDNDWIESNLKKDANVFGKIGTYDALPYSVTSETVDRLYITANPAGYTSLVAELATANFIIINQVESPLQEPSDIGGMKDRLFGSDRHIIVEYSHNLVVLRAIDTTETYYNGIGGMADRLFVIGTSSNKVREIDPESCVQLNIGTTDIPWAPANSIGGIENRLYIADSTFTLEVDTTTLDCIGGAGGAVYLSDDLYGVGGPKSNLYANGSSGLVLELDKDTRLELRRTTLATPYTGIQGIGGIFPTYNTLSLNSTPDTTINKIEYNSKEFMEV